MWFDDLSLVREVLSRHTQTATGPVVDVGGLTRPCVARYEYTTAAMKAIEGRAYDNPQDHATDVRDAQMCRFQDVTRPFSFITPDYVVENPELPGGLPIERLSEKYPRTIGLALMLSVLEHVDTPWTVPASMYDAMAPGGLLVVSVPWSFPWHGTEGVFPDNFRYSPTGLRRVFEGAFFEVLEAEWRLDVPAESGVLCTRTGRAQIIQSCYAVMRCKP